MPSTFAPATDVPVPAEYVVGPGDTLEVQLIGNTKGRYSLVVGRDGRSTFPSSGRSPSAAGASKKCAADLEARVREQMIGTQASVSMGELRSIRVFVLGDAETPGSYTVSGLSTITNALFVSGGVKKIGSLRNIELKRNGRTVTTLDLYDLLLQGRHARGRAPAAGRRDLHSAGRRDGRPRRRSAPAGDLRTEERDDRSRAAAARRRADAGGGSRRSRRSSASSDAARSASRSTSNLADAAGRSQAAAERRRAARSGDPPGARGLGRRRTATCIAGEFQFRPGMRIADVHSEPRRAEAERRSALRADSPRDAAGPADPRVLRRSRARAREPGSAANFELAPRDQIFVFDLESGRDRIIEPLMRELRLQSRIDEPTQEVSVAGKIKVPGKYPLEPGMRVSDLMRAGGSLDEAPTAARPS